MSDNSKVFVYLNPFVAIKSDRDPISSWISSRLNTDSWANLCGSKNEELQDMIEELQEEPLFFAGISFEQYRATDRGGIFLNPMLGGLNTDYDRWCDIIRNDHMASVLFLDVPYEVYKEAGDDCLLDREAYDRMTYLTKAMVEHINEQKWLH